MRFLLCLVFAVTAFADYNVYWARSLTATSDDLKGRGATLTVVNNTNYHGFSVSSWKTTVVSGKAEVDGVVGAAGATDGVLGGGPPLAFLGYYDVTATWGAGVNPFTADVSGVASFIGAAWLALVEVGADGSDLSGFRLKSLDWTTANIATIASLHTGSLIGTSSTYPGLTVTLVFATADEAGQLSNGAFVSPKSVQVTINILNYPFKDTTGTSQLRLISAVGTASVAASGTVKTTSDNFKRIRAGPSDSDKSVFYDGASVAFHDADGNTKAVTVTAWGTATTDNMDGASWISQLNTIKLAQSSIHTSFQYVNVTLPQSNNITYDPALGIGASLDKESAALAFAASPFVTVACILLALGKFL